ncbi:hypothetical protein BDAP_000559 [Binucleata daphniae]
MTDSSSSQHIESYYKTIENDCKDAKSHFDNYKYAYIEKLKKEQCLTKLFEKTSFDSEHIQKIAEINKKRLKNIKNVSNDFENEFAKKSEEIHKIKQERKKNKGLIELEKEKQSKLINEYEKLKKESEICEKENEEEEKYKMKIKNIEDRINEYERIGLETDEDNITNLEKILKERKEELSKLKNEVKIEKRNENVEDLFYGYKKTREFFENMFMYKISKIENIMNGFAILIESKNITVWLMIKQNKFDEIKIIETSHEKKKIYDLFEFCKEINDPVVFIRKLI